MHNRLLTIKQKLVYKAIQDYHFRFGKTPTLMALKDFLSKNYNLPLKSLKSVYQYVNSLKQKGLIKKTRGGNSIKLNLSEVSNFVHIPILGSVNAGTPAYELQEHALGYLKVSKKLLSEKNYERLFSMEVSGDSMNLKNIYNSDHIIFEPLKDNPRDGDIVVANIDGNLTIKEFQMIDKNIIGLFPKSSNPEHKPIFLSKSDNLIIIGKVKTILKSPYFKQKPKFLE